MSNPPLVMDGPPQLVLYAVRNRDRQYFWAKGRKGYGDTWVDELKMARIYAKIGPARGTVTFFANAYPQYGIPEIVELRVNEVVALQETARVKKSMDRKAKKKAEYARRHAEWEAEQAQKNLAEAQATLRRLGRTV